MGAVQHSTPCIEVVEPGLVVTVQDLGRGGWRSFGISPSGAADCESLTIGNRLLGNPLESAALELTGGGQALTFNSPTNFALTGGRLGAQLNGHGVPLWTVLEAHRGDMLRFGGGSGWRAYFCVAGGINTASVFDSRSAHLGSGLGGQKLTAKTTLKIGKTVAEPQFGTTVPQAIVRLYSQRLELRALAGPHSEQFQEAETAVFWSSVYTVTEHADRQGLRLTGTPILIRGGLRDVLSEAVVSGTVQITSDGMPIILFAEHQTLGGYAQIAAVASVDLPLLAQAHPGTELRFTKIDIATARRLAHERQHTIQTFEPIVPQSRTTVLYEGASRYEISIGDTPTTGLPKVANVAINGRRATVYLNPPTEIDD